MREGDARTFRPSERKRERCHGRFGIVERDENAGEGARRARVVRVDDERRHARALQHAFRRAAEEDALKAALALGSHHDGIDRRELGLGHDGVGGRAVQENGRRRNARGLRALRDRCQQRARGVVEAAENGRGIEATLRHRALGDDRGVVDGRTKDQFAAVALGEREAQPHRAIGRLRFIDGDQ